MCARLNCVTGKKKNISFSFQDYAEEGQAEDEFAESEYDDNGDNKDAAEAVTTTTEPAKRIGPIIRPFRSNDDLLNALKRRQLNMKSGKKAPSSASEPAESQQNDPAIAHASVSQSKSADRGSDLGKHTGSAAQ